MENKNGLLLFNGDIFMDRENLAESDTEFLFDKLSNCNEEELIENFRHLKGPFSVIFLNKTTNVLYVLRDSLGRNSLLIGKYGENIFLSSVIAKKDDIKAIELPVLGIYRFDLNKNFDEIGLYPWKEVDENSKNYIKILEDFLKINVKTKSTINPVWYKNQKLQVEEFVFHELLENGNFENAYEFLIGNEMVKRTCDSILELLSQSVKERVVHSPNFCKNCITDRKESCSSEVKYF